MALSLEDEDPRSPDARALVAALWDELVDRYGEDGSQPFGVEGLSGARSCFLIARDGEDAVGCGGLSELDARTGEIKHMYVRPSRRGLGLGRRLLEELEDRARRLGYRRLRLETGAPQPEAVRLYERAGYRRIPGYGTYKDDPRTLSFEKQL